MPSENHSPETSDGHAAVRVVLCAYPGIFADAVINNLIAAKGIELIALVYSTRIYSAQETWFSGAVRMIKTSGLRYALLQFMQTDLYTLLKICGLTNARANRLPTLHTKNLNDETGQNYLKKHDPDIVLLANFNQKVAVHTLPLAKIAFLNIHPAILPYYKGVDPVFAALSRKETTIGVSIHRVDEDFDTGDILLQASLPVEPEASVFRQQFLLFKLAGLNVAEVIERVIAQQPPVIANMAGYYDSWPSACQIGDFIKRGGKLIRLSEYMRSLREV